MRVERFRHGDDGEEVEREIVRRMDAAAIVAYDDDARLARAPAARGARASTRWRSRPASSTWRASRRCRPRSASWPRRSAARPSDWQEVRAYYPSSGYSDELVHIFAATGLREVDAEADPGERIEIVPWPLADLDAALAETDDAKTVIGLQWLRAMLG